MTRAQIIKGNVYGGGETAKVEGNTNVEITTGEVLANGTEGGNVYGGGLGNVTEVSVLATINVNGGIVAKDVYGGSALGKVGSTAVNINDGADVRGDVFAGGFGDATYAADITDPTGTAAVTVNKGAKIGGNVYGGNNTNGSPLGAITVDIKGPANETEKAATPLELKDVFGGGKNAATTSASAPKVNIYGCETKTERVFGGGDAASVPATDVTIWGGNVIGKAFGGGNGEVTAADVIGNTQLTIKGGKVTDAFGGSNQNGSIGGELNIIVERDEDACALHVGNLYGGGNVAPSKAGNISILCTGADPADGIDNVFGGANNADIGTADSRSDINLTITAGKIGNVYGGNNNGGNIFGDIHVTINQTSTCGINEIGNVFGAGNKANYDGSPVVEVREGTVTGDVYGGGALADVSGNTTVNLLGGSVGAAYGGGLGSAEIAAIVGGNTTVTLGSEDGTKASKVTGDGIFGGNNINGTPKGHVKVHVLSTSNSGTTYDVPAVYGGGNKAAYVPTDDNDYTEVIIENCETSIEYVYGGGNAAPVPATDVKIYGANAIGNAFAGGNGAGESNPGADIGYKDYYSKTGESAQEYGTGTTSLTIYGGTVEKAFGGSNTLGYIRTHAKVELAEYPYDYEGSICDLHVGDVHGGGNHAEMFCDGTVILGCTEGAEAIYAGADNADINGNLEITITSGTFGKVFGGNNQGGCIRGSITVNIDETGCKPIYIGELYGCGDNAPYSVYGYNNDKTPKKNGDVLYNDPVVNLISFTKIGKVFGGGNGTGATVYGNPTVNINSIKGVFAGRSNLSKDVVPYIINNSDERVKNNEETIDIPDEVGTIRNVYGGGNKAAVFGNTTLNIGTKATAKHISGSDDQEKDVSVLILGNVFGGSKGVSNDPAAGRVTGTTKVIIGE